MTLEAVVMDMMMGFLMLTSHIDGGCDDDQDDDDAKLIMISRMLRCYKPSKRVFDTRLA